MDKFKKKFTFSLIAVLAIATTSVYAMPRCNTKNCCHQGAKIGGAIASCVSNTMKACKTSKGLSSTCAHIKCNKYTCS